MNAIDEAGVDFSEDANQRLEHCKIKKRREIRTMDVQDRGATRVHN